MSNSRIKNRALCGVLGAVFLLFTGCGSGGLTGQTLSDGSKADRTGMKAIEYTSGDECALAYDRYVQVSENGRFSLSINESDGAIELKNLSNGYSWYSSYDMPANGVGKQLNETWRFNLNSLIYISYYESSNNSGVDSQTNAFAQNALIRTENNGNKAEIDYYFEDCGIGLTVEIELTDYGFDIGVPTESIYEAGEGRLTKIALAPYFGGAPSSADGYLFYPDGSGALAYFDPDNTLKPAETLTVQTYGTENLNVSELLSERILERKQAMLPVFGLKNGDNAFFGVITEGAADSSVNASVSNLIADINNIYASFEYRRRIDITSVNNSIGAAKDAKSYRYDSVVSGGDIKVSYYILDGDNADYSGMAEVYRDYLNENKLLNKTDCGTQPLALSVFMGAYEDRALFSKYMTTTTYDQAAEIVSELTEAGIESINLTLNGWNKGGYRASVMPAEFNGKYGSREELRNIAEKSGGGVSVYLKQDYTYFDSDVSSFSKGKDIAYQGTGLSAQDENIYLPNITGLFTRYLSRFNEFAGEYGCGTALVGTGSQLYTDYNSNSPMTRRESEAYITGWFAENSDTPLMTEGNMYMLKYTDGIINVPDDDSGYPMTDEGIPFYQMVVHGSIPYSSETCGNLSANLERLKLKWIEYGYCPTFEVTYSSSSDLKYTDYNELYSSKFSNWKEEIAEIYEEISGLGVSGAEMVKHEKLAENVYKVTYSNGTVITVNYGSTDFSADGQTVKAESYTVRKGE